MITPSGANRFSGSAFEFNRDAKYAANEFFNNASSLPKPALSRHQFGGRFGSPIQKDKIFFFGYYEGFRQETQFSRNLTVPANPDFFDGTFRYAGTDGVLRSVNVMALSGQTVDPTLRNAVFNLVPNSSNVNNFDTGNSTATRNLNTAGYRFNQTDLTNRDQWGFKIDYALSDKHRFDGGFHYFKETDDRTDLDFISLPRPLVYTSSDPKRFALAWRYLASSNFQNELRGSANLAPVQFESEWAYCGILYPAALGIVDPIGGNGAGVGFQPQGRYTNTYQINDNASWLRGSHQLTIGGSFQRNHVNPYNFAGAFPQVVLRLQPVGADITRPDDGTVPGRHHGGRTGQCERDGGMAGRHDHVGAAHPSRCPIPLRVLSAASPPTRTTRSTTLPPTSRTTGAGSRTSPSARV